MTDLGARVDVVIPALNEENTIQRCVRAVRTSMDAAGIEGEIFVVDDASVDNTADKARDAGATLLRQPVRGGPLRAWMAGVAAGSAPWVVFTDADCRLDSRAFTALLSSLADATVGVVAGRSVPDMVRGCGGPVVWSARFSAVLLHEIKRRLTDHDFLPIGRLMAVRRQFWAVDNTTAGPCDRTVAHAARTAGARVVYCPAAVVFYTPVAKWSELSKDYFRTVHSKAAERYNFDSIPRDIEVRAAVSSILRQPLGAVSWALCRTAFRSTGSRSSSSDVALRWNADRSGRAAPVDKERGS